MRLSLSVRWVKFPLSAPYIKMKYAVIILFILLTFNAFAQDHKIEAGYNFYTHHTGRSSEQLEELNEKNHGIYFSFDRWEALKFITSRNRNGLFLGRNFWEYDYYPFDNGLYGGVNIHGGVLKGYAHVSMPSFKGLIIMIAPSFELGYEIKKYCIAVETFTSIRPWNGKGLTAWIVKTSINW